MMTVGAVKKHFPVVDKISSDLSVDVILSLSHFGDKFFQYYKKGTVPAEVEPSP